MRFGFGERSGGDVEDATLHLPGERQLHAHETIDGHVPRLLAEQDRFDDVGREERQREKLADIGFSLPRRCGEVFEGSRLAGGERTPPLMRLAYGVNERAVHLLSVPKRSSGLTR